MIRMLWMALGAVCLLTTRTVAKAVPAATSAAGAVPNIPRATDDIRVWKSGKFVHVISENPAAGADGAGPRAALASEDTTNTTTPSSMNTRSAASPLQPWNRTDNQPFNVILVRAPGMGSDLDCLTRKLDKVFQPQPQKKRSRRFKATNCRHFFRECSRHAAVSTGLCRAAKFLGNGSDADAWAPAREQIGSALKSIGQQCTAKRVFLMVRTARCPALALLGWHTVGCAAPRRAVLCCAVRARARPQLACSVLRGRGCTPSGASVLYYATLPSRLCLYPHLY